MPLTDLWVTANFKETQLKRMHPGQRVTIRVDAYDRDYEGFVEDLAGASGARFSLLPPENATGNYVKVVQRVPVRIGFKPGQDPRIICCARAWRRSEGLAERKLIANVNHVSLVRRMLPVVQGSSRARS